MKTHYSSPNWKYLYTAFWLVIICFSSASHMTTLITSSKENQTFSKKENDLRHFNWSTEIYYYVFPFLYIFDAFRNKFRNKRRHKKGKKEKGPIRRKLDISRKQQCCSDRNKMQRPKLKGLWKRFEELSCSKINWNIGKRHIWKGIKHSSPEQSRQKKLISLRMLSWFAFTTTKS